MEQAVKVKGICFTKKFVVDENGNAIVTKEEFTDFWKVRAWLDVEEAKRLEMISNAYDIITGAEIEAKPKKKGKTTEKSVE